MDTSKSRTRRLTLDKLVVNPRLARCLPAGLAFHYHALPVAKDNGHITVAMADPDDETAYKAILTALGAEVYAVQSDAATIDQLLAKIWPSEAPQTVRLLVYHQTSPQAAAVETYAHYLKTLLNGQLSIYQTESDPKTAFDDLVARASCDQDLVIFGEPDQSPVRRILLGPMGCKAADRIPTSVLIARRPRSPLKKILLVTRGQEGVDNVAVDWIVRLSQPSNAIVNVLALVPAMPPMYQRAMIHMPHGLSDWLTTDTPLGWQLRQLARQLVNWEITGKLRFRQGPPNRQIQSEVAAEDYDLLVMATDPSRWWQRRLLGDLVNPILHWTKLSVLIAKATIT